MLKKKLFPLLFLVLLLAGCAQKQNEWTTLHDFDHATLGVFSGGPTYEVSVATFPEAERKTYGSLMEMVLAAKTHKIDGFVINKCFYAAFTWEDGSFACVDEPLADDTFCYILPKTPDGDLLTAQINAYLSELEESGQRQALEDKWLSGAEPEDYVIDLPDKTGPNGTLRVALSTDDKPLSYLKNGGITGYEIELLSDFCRAYGYGMVYDNLNFPGLLTGIQTARYDIGAYGITWSPDRAESYNLTNATLHSDMVMVYYNDDASGFDLNRWLDSVKSGFIKTFVAEARWKMILRGIGVTLCISLLSALCGTALGFGLYLLRRSGKRSILRMLAGYSRLIESLPEVVFLMILFYVVLGKTTLDAMWVSVIGFSMIFGRFVLEKLTESVSVIDVGQMEAARALGYSDRRGFFRFILPQAVRLSLPAYQSQISALIKSTSIVGYIAVQDLTKIGEIIRGTTYAAFFPLLTVGILYFLLTWAIARLMTVGIRLTDPRRRTPEEILRRALK